MKTGIIIGSHRKNSQSGKVGSFLKSLLEKRNVETYTLSLENNPIPLWDESFWEKESELKKFWESYSNNLKSCTSFIVITPEYNGMASPALKNLFLYISSKEVGFKPALLAGVSSSRGGAYPIKEMRSSSYKNPRINYIPEHLIFREVKDILNDEKPENENDSYMRARSEYALDVLTEFDSAYSTMDSSKLFNSDFGNGM